MHAIFTQHAGVTQLCISRRMNVNFITKLVQTTPLMEQFLIKGDLIDFSIRKKVVNVKYF